MLLIQNSSHLWDKLLSFNPSHLSVLTYGFQKTIFCHSVILHRILVDPRSRVLVCPNNGTMARGFPYRETSNVHTKTIILHRDKESEYYLTSMNLEVGLWENFLFKVTDKNIQKQMLNHFDKRWERASSPEPLPTFDHLIK